MARFNTAVASTTVRTVNLAGGEAFQEDARLELASILVTSMVQDQFYRSAEGGMARLVELLQAVLPLFAAKAAVFARNEFGMRSISHVVAGEIALSVHGERWTRPFFNAVIRRPDDMTEILSYVIAKQGRRPLPNALKDGLARAFGKFDTFQLARYRQDDKAVSMVDVVNLVHPKPTERNAEALQGLVAGTLREASTFESALSAAGNVEGGDEAAGEAKSEAWATLITEKTIGQLALLRNLRNIAQQSPESIPAALELLVDEERIKRSLILPFRYSTAADQIAELPQARTIMEALDRAATAALTNVPRMTGRTLVVVDDSGSMTTAKVGRGDTLVADAAALFGAALYGSQDADLMLFDTTARYVTPRSTGVLGRQHEIRSVMHGGGTDFNAIFPAIIGEYERIIILSDMQGWVGFHAPTAAFEAYAQRATKRPHVYSWDLAGYGALQLPQPQVYAMAGFSEKVFEVMALLEGDRNALVSRIDAVTF